MRHLRWVDDPYYRGYCIRKNSTTLMKSGGLFEEALDMYRQFDPKVIPKYKDQKLVFPSGASVSFSHYENSKSSELYRGLQLSSVFYDEATDSEESHIFFLISRLRSKAKMEPSIWLTCNPNPSHFLRKWIDWWLYPEEHEKFGLPDPEKNGKVRWMVRIAGELHWGDSKEELIERYGNPKLSIDHNLQIKPLSVQGLLGTIYDNPVLISGNPGYLASLEAMPEVEKRRNLYGDWEAREQNSTFFNRSWVEEVDYVDPDDVVATARTFDFAVTLKSDNNPSPDYTASVRMRKLKSGVYVIDDVRRTRIRAGDWEQFVMDCANADPPNTAYYLPLDPGAASRRATDMFARQLSENGLWVKKIATNRSKLERFRPFSSMAQNGGIQFLSNCGTDFENKNYDDLSFVYKELENFTGQRKKGESGHDDIVDACSDAFYVLASSRENIGNIGKQLTSFTQDMRVSNPFK